MTTIIILIVLILINAVSAYMNYENENYRVAMFNTFACGFISFALMDKITLYMM